MSELSESDLFSSKGFSLISSAEIPDCTSTGIYLRHDRTGLEVFHLQNDDAENLFAFAFRTPVKDSTGAAHILEHSVFCGSQKFPLKEPFANLMNQSVNTFLNAMTYSDKTVYPASSQVRSDYFNLLDVYGDAVFFPLLRKEAFLQEAHRLEIDGKGEFSIQGVVYNEMKGNYSSFESVAADVQLRSLFPDTNYAFDSGGDPLSIPDFSYEAFRAFHEKYYRPDNCLVFLYGNIPTAEQLDFLQERLLNRLEARFPVPPLRKAYPFVPEECVLMETAAPCEEPIEVRADAPDSGATGSTVTLNWLCGDTSDIDGFMECAFLAEVLVGHDGSPLAKALIESGLGDDLAPITGTVGDGRQFLFSLGLHGVKSRDADGVKPLILDTLSKLCGRSIDRRDIDSALMASEFANREVFRSGGPYSLVLLERVLNGWNYGRAPSDMLFCRAAFEKIRAKIAANPDYVQDLIRRHLLENRRRSFVVVSPSKSYLERRVQKEKALLARLERAAVREDVKREMDLLHSYQQRKETAEEAACIPGLSLSDLSKEADCVFTDLCERGGDGPSERTAVFKNVEKTNGIAYVEFCVPVDALPAEAYPYLPLYAGCAANSGWNGKKWDECAAETAVHTGGIGAKVFSVTAAEGAEAERLSAALSPYNCLNRDWFCFSTRILSEHLEDGMKVFLEAFSTFEFTDSARIKKLVAEAKSSIRSSVIPRGNKYAAIRVKRFGNHSCTVNEIWHGITQLFFIDRISEEDGLSARFAEISETIRKSGAIVHLTADGETMRALEPLVDAAIKQAGLCAPKPRARAPECDFSALVRLPEESGQEHEAFSASTQVGFAAASVPCARFGSQESAAELVYAHWLSGTALWEKIRTTGGAYGASASCATIPGLFVFSSYRDPTPDKSLSVLEDVLSESAEELLNFEECARLIAGTYGDEVQPDSPSGRGNAGFMRMLCCVSDAERSALLRNLLSVTPEAVRAAARRISSAAEARRSAVISGDSSKKCGVIVKLPL